MGISDISPRDIEQISAYLDGELTPQEVTRLEARLWQEPQLRDALDELGRTRTMLRSMPRLRAPRNFTISPKMAAQIKRRRFDLRLYPIFGFASALATIVLLFVLSVDFLGVGSSIVAQPALQPTSAIVAMEAAQPESPSPVEPSPAALKMAEAPQDEAQPAMADTPIQPTSTESILTETLEPESTLIPESTSETIAQATPDEREGGMSVVPSETVTVEQASSEGTATSVTTTEVTATVEISSVMATEMVSPTATQSPSPIPVTGTQVPATEVAQAATQPPTMELQPTITQDETLQQPEINPQRSIGEQPVLLVLEIGLGLLVLGTLVAALWSFFTRS